MAGDRTHRQRLVEWLACQHVAGTDEELVPSRQIFLLGGNPMPIRIAAEILRPKRLAIVSTGEAANALIEAVLEEQLRATCGVEAFRVFKLPDKLGRWDARAIFEETAAADDWLQDGARDRHPVGLHYSGGTKAMVRHAARWFDGQAKETDRHRATYMDQDGLVVDGLSVLFPTAGVSSSFEEIVQLHGLGIVSEEQPEDSRLVEAIAGCAIERGQLEAYVESLPPLYPPRARVPLSELRPGGDSSAVRIDGELAATHSSNFRSGPFRDWSMTQFFQLCPGAREVGESAGTLVRRSTDLLDQYRYLLSGWFEDYVYSLLRKKWQLADVRLSVKLAKVSNVGEKPKKEDFELDVVRVAAARPLLVSCTIARNKGLIGDKVMEAAQRASQFGGDLTRLIVASLAFDDVVLTEAWNELRSHWDAPDRVRVLGIEHFRNGMAVTHVKDGKGIREPLDAVLVDWPNK